MTAAKRAVKKATAKKATAKRASVRASSAKKTKKASARRSSRATRTVRIRMYDVGFGDSFLLVVPGEPDSERPYRTILVDAGFHSQGVGAFQGRELAQTIISHLVELSGAKRIDVLIATHRHQDHIYAFNAAEWDEAEIGEVWLPWVEDVSKPEIRKLWKKHKSFTASVAAAPRDALSAEDRAELEFLLWNAGEDVGPAPADPRLAALYAAWSNAAALDRLRDGFGRRDRREPRYLPEADQGVETFETEALPGARIHVLGPPRRAELLAELDPSVDDETYRAFAVAPLSAGDSPPPPFDGPWIVENADPATLFGPDELDRLASLAPSGDSLMAARALDGIINATSLVLVLQIGKARLLLPGDAEWGTWKCILADERAVALLRGTTFLKVGHHGSHNATPKTLVEQVLPDDGVRAMVSTQEGPGTYRHNIPLPALMAALEARHIHPVRSDHTDAHLPDGYRASADGRWIDLELPC